MSSFEPGPRRVFLVAPFPTESGRGNSVAVNRIVKSLRSRGVHVDAIAASASDAEPAGAIARARSFAPDLVHCVHAFRSGPLSVRIARTLSVPLVVSFRGTDADECLDDPERAPVVRESVEAAAVLITLGESQRERVLAHFPERASTTLVVPQGVEPDPSGRDFRSELELPAQARLVVQLAGIRWIKGIPRGLAIVDRAQNLTAELRYVLAGQVLEDDVAAEVLPWFFKRPWSAYLGELKHRDATALVRSAHAFLNSSEREGSSNAILEAMALGVPVIAHDIPPNRELIAHGRTGLLYGTQEQGAAALASVLEDVELAARLGREAAGVAREHFSLEKEALGQLDAYAMALARG